MLRQSSVHDTYVGCALAMKVPIVLRPSNDDLFTPYRLVTAFLDAGLPEDATHSVPGGHDLVDPIVQSCALSATVRRTATGRSLRIEPQRSHPRTWTIESRCAPVPISDQTVRSSPASSWTTPDGAASTAVP
jgi:hypothetical protein